MLPPELIKQIKQIQYRAGHLVTDSLAGEYLSAFKGLGQEFEKVREYTPGDDVRAIDWNVTARMNMPFVKVYQEERELTLMVMVDVSPSQGFGSSGRFKRELAVELAAVLAYLAINNNDKVGLIVFSDHVEQFIPPAKGRAHVWRMIRAVLTHEGSGKRTDINTALEYLMRVCRRKTMCFMVSDFCAEGYERLLSLAAKRHDLVCAVVEDRRERSWQPLGLVELEDAETGERLLVDTGSSQFRRRFEQLATERERSLVSLFNRQGIDHFMVDTAVGSVVTPLARYMRQRERRMQR